MPHSFRYFVSGLLGICGLSASAFAGPLDATTNAPEPGRIDFEQVTLFGDIGETLSIAWDSSYSQLAHADTLSTLGIGALAVWAADDRDDAWLDKLRQREYLTNDIVSFVGDETALALTAVPAITWLLANQSEDEKLRRYSIETMSAISLVYAETLFIAHVIPTHDRPRDSEGNPATSFFDTAFRGEYSFPSGHMIAPFLVTMKTWDYYGWQAAFLPATVTAVSAFNRIADGSHYPSDVVASAVLSLSAHWATRRTTRERDEHFHWSVGPVAGGGMMLTGGFDF